MLYTANQTDACVRTGTAALAADILAADLIAEDITAAGPIPCRTVLLRTVIATQARRLQP
jgi:hypothetical protein